MLLGDGAHGPVHAGHRLGLAGRDRRGSGRTLRAAGRPVQRHGAGAAALPRWRRHALLGGVQRGPARPGRPASSGRGFRRRGWRRSTTRSAPSGRAARCRPLSGRCRRRRRRPCCCPEASIRPRRRGMANAVARALGAKARHEVVPHAGHGLLALPCVRDTVFRFVDAASDADALRVDAVCARDIPRPPAFVPLGAGGAPMIEVRGIARRFVQGHGRSARVTVQAVDGRELGGGRRLHQRPARPQRRRQDDDAAHASPGWSRPTAARCRSTASTWPRSAARGAGTHGRAQRRARPVSAADGAGEHRLLRTAARHDATLLPKRARGRWRRCWRCSGLLRPPHRRLQPGRAHEDGAGPGPGARPAQHRPRRADQRPGRAGHARAARDPAAAARRAGQVHRLFDPPRCRRWNACATRWW